MTLIEYYGELLENLEKLIKTYKDILSELYTVEGIE